MSSAPQNVPSPVAIVEVWPDPPILANFTSVSQADFNYSGFSWYPYYAAGADYAVQRSSGGVGNVFRFEVRPGDVTPEDLAFGGTQATLERAEINHNGSLDDSKIILLSFLQMIEPGAYSPASADFCIIGQFHQVADAEETHGGPPIRQTLNPNEIVKVITETSPAAVLLYDPPLVQRYEGAMVRGKWYSWRYRFKYSPAEDGVLQVWRNNIPVVDYSGPVGYNDLAGPSPQLGIYRSPSAQTLVAYYADISLSYE